jgi:hypothetical protein
MSPVSHWSIHHKHNIYINTYSTLGQGQLFIANKLNIAPLIYTPHKPNAPSKDIDSWQTAMFMNISHAKQ